MKYKIERREGIKVHIKEGDSEEGRMKVEEGRKRGRSDMMEGIEKEGKQWVEGREEP